MGSILATAAVAAGLFAGTNIDDMVVLAVLNVSSRVAGRPRRWQIWAGQYAGVAALVIISLAAALGFALVPDSWIWVLGLIPLLLGLRKLVDAIRARDSEQTVSPTVASGLAGVTGLTIANGGDNVAAYTLVFRTMQAGALTITLVIFAVGVAVWCAAGAWLVSHRRVDRLVRTWGHWIVPAVFMLIGLYVFYKAGIVGI